jgi:hypothetical protein
MTGSALGIEEAECEEIQDEIRIVTSDRAIGKHPGTYEHLVEAFEKLAAIIVKPERPPSIVSTVEVLVRFFSSREWKRYGIEDARCGAVLKPMVEKWETIHRKSIRERIRLSALNASQRAQIQVEAKTKANDEAVAVLVKIDREMRIKEDFRIPGADIGEPDQDLIFEKCLINGTKAYRIRPYRLETGAGGHGDDILEIACSEWIPNATPFSEVEVGLFRNQDA